MKTLTAIACAMSLVSVGAFAQTCKFDSIERTQPIGQYFDNKDGTVTDIVNGLIWTKCSVGEVYDEAVNSCSGEATHLATWKEALNTAHDNKQQLGVADWRLPNIKELSTLVERACVAPSISLTAFPTTPSAVYWSNTSDAKNINPIAGVNGLVIDFSNGAEFVKDVNRHRHIRLVRPIN